METQAQEMAHAKVWIVLSEPIWDGNMNVSVKEKSETWVLSEPIWDGNQIHMPAGIYLRLRFE